MFVSTMVTLVSCIFCLTLLKQSTAYHPEEASFSASSVWPGHLQPLGSHATKHPVSSIDHFPAPVEFFRSYVYPSVPVIIRQGAKRSPAYRKWSDEYFKNMPELEELVTVEMHKVEERELPRMTIPFAEFIDRYQTHDMYLVGSVPDFLKKDVLVPPSIRCTSITSNLVDTILWFSNGGTKSHLHTDYIDNINCLFRGRKDFLFVNYTQYKHQIVFDHPEGFYSSVDVERVDFNEFPWIRGVEFWEANLEAGDCLYVPFKWIHQVNSYGKNIAVNIWWNHQAYIIPNAESCNMPNANLSLADVVFYNQDQTHADSRGSLFPELEFFHDPQQSLTTYMDEEELQALTKEQFLTFMITMMPTLDHGVIWDQEALQLTHEIFEILDTDMSGEITPHDTDMYQHQSRSVYVDFGRKMMILGDVLDGRITGLVEELLQDEISKVGGASQDNPNPSTGTSEQSRQHKAKL